MPETTTVTVEVDLEKVAEGVANYYKEMQEGQVAEFMGDTDTAFTQAKKVIGLLAGIMDGVLGRDNVGRVNTMASDMLEAGA